MHYAWIQNGRNESDTGYLQRVCIFFAVTVKY